MSPALISIDKLSKKYTSSQEYSLNNVTFEIHEGEVFGIFGPNGAGKTTLISILCGIIHASSGTAHFYKNQKRIPLDEIKTNIGYVPQDLAIYNDLTAFQNIEYFGALYNMNKKSIKEQSEKLFDLLGLRKVAHKKIKTFSGGMKRRLNLAIGVIHQPSILFLDEPSVGVDIHSRNAINEFLKGINNNGTTIIYTSHQLEEAEKLCKRIAVLDNGMVIALDYTKNLLESNCVESLQQLLIKLTGNALRDHV